MADAPAARDEDRLPWLESFEGERARRRRPVSRTALVGLLVAFFGVGLAVAFSLGYRFARPAAEAPVPPTAAPQPERAASVNFPLSPPVPLPKVELVAPPPVVEAPVEPPKTAEAPKPVAKKAKAPKKRYAKRKPILRPFKLTRQPTLALAPAPTPTTTPTPASPPPVRSQPPSPPGPKGRMIQLGAYSTQRQAESAWRTIVWRYPYLKTKPRVVEPTKPLGGWTYYRLRLGTETQAQSLVICQQLLARGQSCIVIY